MQNDTRGGGGVIAFSQTGFWESYGHGRGRKSKN